MSFRVFDAVGQVLGVLRLTGTVRVIDLESLRSLGAHRVELVKTRES